VISEAIKTSEVIIFDCDGVLMDSNRIKEEAFVKIAQNHLGNDAADFIREFHRQNGGVSRVVKFQTTIERFYPEKIDMIDNLCSEFEALSRHEILHCQLALRCEEVLTELQHKNKRLMVLSGTPTKSLKDVLSQRNLLHYFDEIMGSPTSKVEHLTNLHKRGVLKRDQKFIFIGDSMTDLTASREFENCQFFWSREFQNLQEFAKESVNWIDQLNHLLRQRPAP
jgi:phosphoglycolate phosphatase-like HAD superfamily hydrolase